MRYNGNKIKVAFKGESHSKKISLHIKGLEKGLKFNQEEIEKKLKLRHPEYIFNTPRKEPEEIIFEKGYDLNGTTGKELVISIFNKDSNTRFHKKLKGFLRPGHADYVGYITQKNYKFDSSSFSGRMTALMVVLGEISKELLKDEIIVISHIYKIGDIYDQPLNILKMDDIDLLNDDFPVIDKNKKAQMINLLENINKDKDSIGAQIETVIYNLKEGIGDVFFDSLEGEISKNIFTIPAVKAIEFGEGTNFSNLKGSEANDSFYYDGKIKTKTNHNGGINGGISNGMPIRIITTIKPTPSIGKPQTSFNVITNQEETRIIKGRNDSFIANRAIPAINGAVYYSLLNLIRR